MVLAKLDKHPQRNENKLSLTLCTCHLWLDQRPCFKTGNAFGRRALCVWSFQIINNWNYKGNILGYKDRLKNGPPVSKETIQELTNGLHKIKKLLYCKKLSAEETARRTGRNLCQADFRQGLNACKSCKNWISEKEILINNWANNTSRQVSKGATQMASEHFKVFNVSIHQREANQIISEWFSSAKHRRQQTQVDQGKRNLYSLLLGQPLWISKNWEQTYCLTPLHYNGAYVFRTPCRRHSTWTSLCIDARLATIGNGVSLQSYPRTTRKMNLEQINCKISRKLDGTRKYYFKRVNPVQEGKHHISCLRCRLYYVTAKDAYLAESQETRQRLCDCR